jgi:DNA polymerase-3 subunit alpha
LKLSKKYKIDIVGTNDCHYINAEDEKTQQVLLAIQTQAKWNDENRFKFNTK